MVVTEDTGGCRAGSWAMGRQQAGRDTGRVGTGTQTACRGMGSGLACAHGGGGSVAPG